MISLSLTDALPYRLFDLKPFISTISYDGVYNTAPEFERNWDYTPRSLAHWMDDDSSYVFEVLKNAISEKLHMPYQSTGCKLPL